MQPHMTLVLGLSSAMIKCLQSFLSFLSSSIYRISVCVLALFSRHISLSAPEPLPKALIKERGQRLTSVRLKLACATGRLILVKWDTRHGRYPHSALFCRVSLEINLSVLADISHSNVASHSDPL